MKANGNKKDGSLTLTQRGQVASTSLYILYKKTGGFFKKKRKA
jgi:hypothetical protein